MIFHTLHFKFNDDVSQQAQDDLLADLRAVKDVVLCVVGQKIGDQDGYTHTYCVAYDNVKGMEKYLVQPGHRELVSRFADIVEKFTTVDFSDDLDPTLGDTLSGMLDEWMAPVPDLAARLESLQAK